MTQQEQNKKINELNSGRTDISLIRGFLGCRVLISNAFDAIDEHLDEHDKKFDQLQYDLNQANGKLDAILDRITGLSDLPEE